MIKFNFVPHGTLTLFVAFMTMLLPLKTLTVAATDTSEASPACQDGYEYVEAVGKCYKACSETQERNPETLRCRKIQTTAEDSSGSSSDGSDSGSSSDEDGSEGETSSTVLSCKDGYEYIEAVGKCYKACSEGYARNAETLRCRKVVVESEYESETETTSTAVTCKEGYEYVELAGKCYKACSEGYARNSETLRCRKIIVDSEYETEAAADGGSTIPTCKEGYEYVEMASKCYKACSEGQKRNPETNRCRKVQTSSESSASVSGSDPTACKEGYEYVAEAGKCYKACQDGYERNLETMRCRKKTDNGGADYAVDVPTTGEARSSQTGFTALGAVLALAAVAAIYIIYQFRHEILRLVRKITKKA